MNHDPASLASMRLGEFVPGVITAVVAVIECMAPDGTMRLVRIADSTSPPWKIHGMVEYALSAEPIEEL